MGGKHHSGESASPPSLQIESPIGPSLSPRHPSHVYSSPPTEPAAVAHPMVRRSACLIGPFDHSSQLLSSPSCSRPHCPPLTPGAVITGRGPRRNSRLKLGDNLTSADWKRTPRANVERLESGNSPVITAIVAGTSQSAVAHGRRHAQVCNGKYGNNGWLGLASINITGGIAHHTGHREDERHLLQYRRPTTTRTSASMSCARKSRTPSASTTSPNDGQLAEFVHGLLLEHGRQRDEYPEH